LNSLNLSKVPSLVLAPKVIGAEARACARNPAILLIPYHPVVRKNDELGRYRWRIGRKEVLLRMDEAPLAKLKR